MSISGIGKTIGAFEQNIVRVLKEGTDLVANAPNTTRADIDNWEADCKNVFKTGAQNIDDEAYSQMQEQASQHLIDRGLTKEEADRIAQNTIKKIADLAEKARKEIPAIKAAAGHGWGKFLGFIGAVTAGFSLLTTVSMFSHDQRADEMRSGAAFIEHIADEQDEIRVDSGAMNSLIDGLRATPPPNLQAPPPMGAAEPIPYIPPAVAAVAAQPATAAIRMTNGSTQTVQTTVGRIYGVAPAPVRRFMVAHPPPPPTGYDYDHHEDFTVDSGFASIEISY